MMDACPDYQIPYSEREYDRIEDYCASASDALRVLNMELEQRAAAGDPEAIRYLNEIWGEEK